MRQTNKKIKNQQKFICAKKPLLPIIPLIRESFFCSFFFERKSCWKMNFSKDNKFKSDLDHDRSFFIRTVFCLKRSRWGGRSGKWQGFSFLCNEFYEISRKKLLKGNGRDWKEETVLWVGSEMGKWQNNGNEKWIDMWKKQNIFGRLQKKLFWKFHWVQSFSKVKSKPSTCQKGKFSDMTFWDHFFKFQPGLSNVNK